MLCLIWSFVIVSSISIRSFEAEVAFLEIESVETTTRSSSKAQSAQLSPERPKKMICCRNCTVCKETMNSVTSPANRVIASPGIHSGGSRWLRSKGRFLSIGGAVISCRNGRAPDGLVADAHLADGFLHLIMIKDCPRPHYLWYSNWLFPSQHLWTTILIFFLILLLFYLIITIIQSIFDRHLTQLTRKGSDPLNFEFIEHHKVHFLFVWFITLHFPTKLTGFFLQTSAFTFVSTHDESFWNLDGELLQACQISVQVFRGLVNLFASGPEV